MNRTRRIALLFLPAVVTLFAAFCMALPRSASAGLDFDEANRLYEKGAYADAAKAYESLLGPAGVSPSVLYNLGNARFKAGQTGLAIAAYRQALTLDPADPDIQTNLRFARGRVSGPSWQPSRGEAWLKKLTLNQWALIAASAFWLTLGLAVTRFLRPPWKPALQKWILLSTVATIVCATLLTLASHQSHAIVTAVVISREAPVHFGPLDESALAFAAANGAELRVIDQKDNWVQVAADQTRGGWIRKDQIILSPGP